MRYLVIIAIIIVGFFLRFYLLGSIPAGLNQDETAIGYNAYSILQTGKDEYGEKYPLYFKSFNDYKLPVYIYLTALSVKVFGLNAFAVRFPSALFGSLAIIIIFFLVKIESNRTDLAAISSLFLAINPWHFFFSRTAFEVNVAVALQSFAILLFFLALKYKNNIALFFFSIIFFLLSLYCYNVTRILSPTIFLVLLGLQYVKVKKMKLQSVCLLGGTFLLGLLPFIVTFINGSNFSSQQSVLIFSGESLAKIIEFKSYIATFPQIISSTLFNKWILVLWQYMNNLVAFISPSFFFIDGGSNGAVGVGNYGMFHLFQFPLFVLGFYYGLKNRVKFLYFFFIWIGIIFTIVSISYQIPPPTRSFALVIPVTVIASYGLLWLIDILKKMDNRVLQVGIYGAGLFICIYSLLFYFSSYYFRFPIQYADSWRQQDQPLALYLQNQQNKYDRIIIDKSADFIYTSLLFYQRYDPQQFQAQVLREDEKLFRAIKKIGKYEYRKIDWEKDIRAPKTLLVTDKVNYSYSPVAYFYLPERPVVLYFEKKIAQYPVKDLAYVVYESIYEPVIEK